MANLIGESTDGTVPAVKGVSNPNGGIGVHGVCDIGHGVRGESIGGRGVVGRSQTFVGVFGHSVDQIGVAGESDNNVGVFGKSPHGFGIQGVSETNHGVHGDSISGRGVQGISQTFIGVSGTCKDGVGVGGESTTGVGVKGQSKTGNGVQGDSEQNDTVVGFAHANGKAGVLGLAPDGNALVGISDHGNGIFAKGAAFAGVFEGNVNVSGNVAAHDIILSGADCAEHFDIADAVEPGTVMVVSEGGALRESHQAYDKCVAGVVSGAGDYRPGIVLDKRQSRTKRLPIGLLGKVYCKVDAEYSAIEVGDLLTTSATPGHAMKATDPHKAFGSVIGKALCPQSEGRGMIPVLVALQ